MRLLILPVQDLGAGYGHSKITLIFYIATDLKCQLIKQGIGSAVMMKV